MISDLQPLGDANHAGEPSIEIVPIASAASPIPRSGGLVSAAVQPVADVQAYLKTRTPQPSHVGEERLLITLPDTVRDETKALVRACEFVRSLRSPDCSVQAACKTALQVYQRWNWDLKTFRAKYDFWEQHGDWVVLVNHAKAPAAWRNGGRPQGLPEAFLKLCEIRFGAFKRADGKRQALLSLKRQWQTGRDEHGNVQAIAGYEVLPDGTPWSKRDTENIPAGWSYSNILLRIKKRKRFTEPVRLLLHDSESAAKSSLPGVLGTRKNLRFLEKITFDDVRTDWLIFNPASGQAEEMWVLVARDEATAMVLGFVMLPATLREDPVTGTSKATHLGAQQMKELAGYLLQTYPLPPYTMHWVVERGTATLAEAVKLALGELFNNRIKVHYTSMIGTKAPNGYQAKKKGNSDGKASHESHNRLFHTQGSFIDGQTGNRWDIRPAELNARCAEAREIYLRSQALPEHLREQVKYPLPTPAIARDKFRQFCLDQNFRTDHKLEDFEPVLEWFDGTKWQPRETAPAGAEFRRRMEMPVERAMRLIRAVSNGQPGSGWERCSPDIIKSFLDHTARQRPVEQGGEITLTHEGKLLIFASPSPELSPTPGTKCLCYFSPDDPQFLHVTSGDGRFHGTWYQRGRTEFLDRSALEQAMRYTHAARKAAQETATELAAPEIASLEAMRAHNNALQQFVVTADVPEAVGNQRPTAIGNALAVMKGQKQAAKQREQRRNDDAAIAREALSNLAT
jgi:hypothetical protein